MDILSFIDSKDIRSYLKDIGHKFTMPEAASIIFNSNRITLDERIGAWRQAADTLPDTEYDFSDGTHVDSFRDFLQGYARFAEEEFSRLKESSPDRAFRYKYLFHPKEFSALDHFDRDEDFHYFPDYESCLAFCKRQPIPDGTKEIAITKAPFGGTGDVLWKDLSSIHLDLNFVPTSLYPSHNNCGGDVLYYYKLWDVPDTIPMPFRCGDIVRNLTFDTVSVFEYLPEWDDEELASCPDWVRRRALSEREAAGDRQRDRNNAWTADYSARLRRFSESIENCLSLEKVTRPLYGYERLCEPLSRMIKGELEPMDFFNESEAILAEERAKDLREPWRDPYGE